MPCVLTVKRSDYGANGVPAYNAGEWTADTLRSMTGKHGCTKKSSGERPF